MIGVGHSCSRPSAIHVGFIGITMAFYKLRVGGNFCIGTSGFWETLLAPYDSVRNQKCRRIKYGSKYDIFIIPII